MPASPTSFRTIATQLFRWRRQVQGNTFSAAFAACVRVGSGVAAGPLDERGSYPEMCKLRKDGDAVVSTSGHSQSNLISRAAALLDDSNNRASNYLVEESTTYSLASSDRMSGSVCEYVSSESEKSDVNLRRSTHILRILE